MIVSNTTCLTQPIIDTKKADAFFKAFPMEKVKDYVQYWESVRPTSNDDIFRRYLFSFASVHTSWQGNVRGYMAMRDFNEWIDDKELLREKLKNSGVGLHNNRTEYIWDFSQKFWANPKDFYFTTKRYHVKKRDAIVSKIKGIAQAKVSFSLEMIHPNECRVLCSDVHILRLYGAEDLKYKTGTGLQLYKKLERHWQVNCGRLKVPSYIARSIYWDGIQDKPDSRYWSYVFEEAI